MRFILYVYKYNYYKSTYNIKEFQWKKPKLGTDYVLNNLFNNEIFAGTFLYLLECFFSHV